MKRSRKLTRKHIRKLSRYYFKVSVQVSGVSLNLRKPGLEMMEDGFYPSTPIEQLQAVYQAKPDT